MCCDVVGEAGLGAASIPQRMGGLFKGVVDLGACPCRWDSCDEEPWRSLPKARDGGEKRGTHSEEDTVPAVFRDPRVGRGADGSWHVLDVVESFVEELTGELSLRPRESGVVSTKRSTASPESLEDKLYDVFPPDQRTSVDVRRWNRWSGVGED